MRTLIETNFNCRFDMIMKERIGGRLVGCFGFYGRLRQYFSLYRAVFQREREEEKK